jgi:hypothetical protein
VIVRGAGEKKAQLLVVMVGETAARKLPRRMG